MNPAPAVTPEAVPASPATAGLKTIGLLAILVFLIGYTYEVLFFNQLQTSRNRKFSPGQPPEFG